MGKSRPKARASRKQLDVVESGGDELLSFSDFLLSLPPHDGISDQPDKERPTKRLKYAESYEAICIAKETLVLPTRKATGPTGNTFVARENVGKTLALRLKKSAPDLGEESDWLLQIRPRNKSHCSSSMLSYLLKSHDLSPKQVIALQVAEAQGFDPHDGGSLWASFDVLVRDFNPGVQPKLVIRIMWNSCATFGGVPQTKSQQYWRNMLVKSCYSELELSATQQWSPQDFYEAANVPDKESSNIDLSTMQVPHLEARLYPFQRRAVQWLLQREGVQWQQGGSGEIGALVPYSGSSVSQELPISFSEVKDVDGKAFYISPLFGVVARQEISKFQSHQNLHGGILAEEMGLGKTIEIISLILLHSRPEGPLMVFDQNLGRDLFATSATLIVTPAALLDQWLSELNKHAPKLRVLYYPGLRKSASSELMTAEFLAEHDVVITTYTVLQSEIWAAADEPTRSMRGARKYERPRSPLVQLSWWRVCIDEAQMVENWDTLTAQMARRIPRVNAWGITGTPVKDDIQKDLRGLLNFLRFEPYASNTKIWNTMTTVGKDSFRRLFNMISMRHTKSMVRSEIEIPPQKRYVITMPFTAVEEQHYQSLFKELTAACGLDVQGNPIRDDWDFEDPNVQAAMRAALDRLRQTALHPEVGYRNRRALGQKARPMRTVAEVLDAMVEQSDGTIRADQRSFLSLKLTKGQLLARLHRVDEALKIWEEVRTRSAEMVAECRAQLEQEVEAARKNDAATDDDNESRPEDEDAASPRVGEARRRLRSALEIQHRAVFFCANAYFSIKSDESRTKPSSDEFMRLEKLEVEGYDLAKAIRKELLQESYGKAKRLMDRIADSAAQQSFQVIPEAMPVNQMGIESRKIADALEELGVALNEQANQLDEWREQVVQMLLKSLVDEEETEATGEEYGESTKIQEEILVFTQVLRAAIADRQSAVSGQVNALVEQETRTATVMASHGEGPSPEKLLRLFKVRDDIRPPFTKDDPYSSLRGLLGELRSLTVKLRHDAATGNSRAATELAIVDKLLKRTQKELADQNKAAVRMEQEIQQFTDTLNARLEFYRQLQAVSDMVGEHEGPADDAALAALTQEEETLRTKLATSEAKHRYLLHLKEAETSSVEQNMCVICQSSFTIGVLTVCGHQFCKECMTLWFRAHRNCPVCKRKLDQSNIHDITLKPQELRVQSDSHNGESANSNGVQKSPTKKVTTIYSDFSPEKLAEIKNIDLDGPCYTTKVDTLVRHLLWLRESDPGAKSIIFSQYKEFLDVLAQAFSRYRIGYASFDSEHGIASFKEDPSIEVFLLHARAHASGLNLVNASHVFLCEPLLNTALELQAIARVDRIGQQHETTVWLYVVDGTVEQSIYNLSVQRRMEHMGRDLLKGKSKESTPELLDASLDAANSFEMQQAQLTKLMGKDGIAGEAVDKQDLWTCLFGATRNEGAQRADEERLVNDPVTRGFLAAEAAERRRDQ